MEDSSPESTSKKSGFSLRKRRSNSKSRKDEKVKPVAGVTDEKVGELEAVRDGEQSVSGDAEASEAKALLNESPEWKSDQNEEGSLEMASGADSSPKSTKGVKNDDSPPTEGASKKKSKRKSRSLFKRSIKKDAEKAAKEESGKKSINESGPQENPDGGEAKVPDCRVSDTEEEQVVVCDVMEKQDEVREHNDVEHSGNAAGEVSEPEAESDVEGLREENDEIPEGSQSGAGDVDDEKKGEEQKRGTKRKGFFKRGLSLKRSKSKKKQDGAETKAEDISTKEVESQCDIGVSTEADFEPNVPEDETTVEEKGEAAVSDVDGENTEEKNCSGTPETHGEENGRSYASAVAKKGPPKPVRKVSFKVESNDEGDSPSEEPQETGNDSTEPVLPSSCKATPSEPAVVVVDLETVAGEKVGEAENPTTTEVDEDTLTEVSSVSSSMLASSEAPSQIDTDDTRGFEPTDTEPEETGSRITLVEYGETGEGSEFKPEVEVDERKSDDDEEVCKLLGDEQKENKNGEWELLNQSYEMSVELQRVRKQTLFSVKRLCCSVM